MAYMASGPREMAATPVRDTSTRPTGAHQLDEVVDLGRCAGQLEGEALRRGVDHAATEGLRQAQRLHAVLALAAHLHHGELALDEIAARREVGDPVDGHEALELVADLLDGFRRARGQDGDARLVFGMATSATVRLSML